MEEIKPVVTEENGFIYRDLSIIEAILKCSELENSDARHKINHF